jgi:4-hydroxy-3-polyprenylbenzoate decarboxylase
MYPDLRSFIRALDASGELHRVRASVSPVLEVAEVADRVSKSMAPALGSQASLRNDPRNHDRGGKALLFERVQGSDFPLLINAWGSYRRMEMALGVGGAPLRGGRESSGGADGFERIASRIAELTKPQPPRSLREAMAKARQFLPLLRIAPRRRSGRGPCQEVILRGEQADCTRLPIIRCWPLDGDFASVGYPGDVNDQVAGIERGEDWNRDFRGRYITLAGIHTIHAGDIDEPKPASHNIGMYRVQLFGPRRLAMHWHMHHDGARHWRSWKKLGKQMPVAIVLGGESVMPYAATAPLPPGISELLLAGFLNGGGIPMVRGVTVPLWIPANAEIVIEGYVNHEAGLIGYEPRSKIAQRESGARAPEGRATDLGPGAVFEGPFGDHTGFYSMPDRYPILEVTAITHRRDAVYPTTIVGLPPQEDYYLGKATERIFLPLLKTLIHDVEDYDLPLFGAFHNCACVKIKKAYPLQGRRVMHSVWGAGQMAWTKTIFVVDDDCDVHDVREVLRRAGAWCEPRRDVEFVNGPLDILDHAAPRLGAGVKVGYDCTRKVPGEEVGGVPVDPDARAWRSAGEEIARACCARALGLPGVRAARVPNELGGAWMLLGIAKGRAGDGVRTIERLFKEEREACVASSGALAAWIGLPKFVVVLDARVDLENLDMALFHWAANFDASRDLVWSDVVDGCGALPARMGFDATPKVAEEARNGQPVRAWPPVIAMDDATKHLVTRRWKEYGL